MANEEPGKESAEVFDRNALWAQGWGEESSDGDSESETNDDGETSGDEDLDPRVQKALEAKIQELVDQLASEDTNSPVFKGMQRRLNERDRKLAELDNTNKQLMALVQEVRGKADSAEEKATFGLETLLSSFDDETRKDLEGKIATKRNQSEVDQLKTLLTAIVKGDVKVGQQPEQQTQAGPDYEAHLATATSRRDEYIAKLKDLAEITGVDPNDKRLDYGDKDTWLASEIQDRFQKSLRAIVEADKEIDGVRQKVKTPATRGGAPGAGKLTAMTAEQLLNEGAMQRLKNPTARKSR